MRAGVFRHLHADADVNPDINKRNLYRIVAFSARSARPFDRKERREKRKDRKEMLVRGFLRELRGRLASLAVKSFGSGRDLAGSPAADHPATASLMLEFDQ